MQLNSKQIVQLMTSEGYTHCMLQRELDSPPCMYQCYPCKYATEDISKDTR